MKTVSVNDILTSNVNLFTFVSGDRNLTVNNISTPEQMEEQSLVFISKPEHIAHCFSKKPKVVISPPQLLNLFNMPVSFTLLTAENFKSALNAVLPLFDDKHEKFNYQIHPSAIISTNVILGKNVKIGPFSYIGENVTIGDNTIVGPSCVIERKATIGNSSILHLQFT